MFGTRGPARDQQVAVIRANIQEDIEKSVAIFRGEGVSDFDRVYLSYLVTAAKTRATMSREELEVVFATLMAEMVMREFDKELPRID